MATIRKAKLRRIGRDLSAVLITLVACSGLQPGQG